MELELRHLRTICVIAETGSLTKAATVLGLSQPALTARLRRVETEIGAALFARGPRGVVPTVVGQFVLSRSRSILHSVADLHDGAARYFDATAPVIALGGAVGSVSVGLAERMVESLTGVEVRLTMEYSPRLLWDLIAAGRLDVVATVDYPGHELSSTADIECVTIAHEPIFVALAASDPLACRDEIALPELANRTWVMTPSDGAGWPDCFHVVCEHAGFTPRVRYTSPSTESIRDLVAGNRAVTACQAVYRGGDGVVVRPLTGSPVEMRHILAYRREGPVVEHMAAVTEFAMQAYWAYAKQYSHHFDTLRHRAQLVH
ncbi:LysR family transcriptional regulator [Actinokineospora diospyrosa]|uniref:DNA-binding transcriptional regulator, LysR family n=1 Tax=Actinokineospora diospyrosa TaxID=103728 RepID=A0ABT1INL8_9PSEU|nr:LysR family transcriptional regulator [Actinokineospora diospyrosa]MCP2274270.1 DNA-binding transcriptional regulator, LysR family [Actinokineospora diospyrosa]